MTSERLPVESEDARSVLYEEAGATPWGLLWAPGLALAGIGFDLVLGIPPHFLGWGIAGGLLLFFLGLWVYARRRFLRVRVTVTHVQQGEEWLPVSRIASIEADSRSDDGQRSSIGPVDTRVLGGSWTVPRKYEELLLRLDDGTLVLAWAKDVEAMGSALRSVL